ncbi:MAG: hypothetical protein RL033_1860 [Pseudomonadota bacterium]|jgi:hypothetical protein
MRFACQSCGKAYNLPEERIADKSNVKLKCRVCGAIVEVKRLGEFVAAPLDEVDGKRVTRVSEAPAPLNSLTPEDDEADGATVSISEGSMNEGGPLHFEMPAVPLAPSTGFSSGMAAVGMPPAALPPGALSAGGLSAGGLSAGGGLSAAGLSASGAGAMPPPLSELGVGFFDAPNSGLPPIPPPLSPSSLPPPPVHAMPVTREAPTLEDRRAPASNGVANGRGEYSSELLAPVAATTSVSPNSGSLNAVSLNSGGAQNSGSGPMGAAVMAAGPSAIAAGLASDGPGLLDLSEPAAGEAKDSMFKFKMLAAFATGIMVDRIISGLFQ